MSLTRNVFVEFHPSRSAREKLQINDVLFATNGDIVFKNMRAVRALTEKLRNEHPELLASQVNALGLLHEIEHIVVQTYQKKVASRFFQKLEHYLQKELGRNNYERLLHAFCRHFPPTPVFRNEQRVEDYLQHKTGGRPNQFLLLEEMIPFWTDYLNPAFQPLRSLIDPKELNDDMNFKQTYELLHRFSRQQPPVPGSTLSLLQFLRQPAELYPHSVMAQLEYIKDHWQAFLGDLLTRLLQSIDFIREEEKARFDKAAFGPGPTLVPQFEPSDEPERFSPDTDWMPRLVLIAKSTYVWLDQLSKKYAHPITRLDQIPDEELRFLASFGITGLWLIGIWERSKASQKIKQRTGNPEAAASAYSLYDYQIADDLGGELALQNLKERVWRYGIRMATDMVPNHTGIDSKWVIEHPERFIQLPYSPYPQYSFNGPDLCDHPDVGVFIEDGYWNRSDAAVVFKRVHYPSGETRYIYHGNDGTSMPWNDTAQLNYLLPEVREAVLHKIIEIARRFPIIRFDAAMTLTKKHFQRLWFPQPGQGGDIPSRAEFSMTKEEFDRLFPKEFWREVVDRIRQEAPDTLLLAEAFWLMESYFVRTLGMHRVYNSAFMNMLKNEENNKYRQLVKNVLEFNPQILKRYVNFMNNPDEETAAVQFGTGDKYFGVCIMLVTMPGLPMFGHGQIEGFREKYGMEYRRAYWDEQEDQTLIANHFKLIAPLLHKRYLFSEVDHFLFYDVFAPEGHVIDSVFAYSNRYGQENALVVYNNSFVAAAGWIHSSVRFKCNDELVQQDLLRGLGLQGKSGQFVVFKDHVSGLEYIRRFEELRDKGLFIALGAYKFNVFLNFRPVSSSQQEPYAELHRSLQGNGVPDLQEALLSIRYRSVHRIVRSLLTNHFIARIPGENIPPEQATQKIQRVFAQCCRDLAAAENLESLNETALFSTLRKAEHLFALMSNKLLNEIVSGDQSFSRFRVRLQQILKATEIPLNTDLTFLHAFFVLQALKTFYRAADATDFDFLHRRLLHRIFEEHLQNLAESSARETMNSDLLKILSVFENGMEFKTNEQMRLAIEHLISFEPVARYLDIHPFQGIYYFNKERFEELVFWLYILGLLEYCPRPARKCKQKITAMKRAENLCKKAEKAGYRWFDFLESLRRRR